MRAVSPRLQQIICFIFTMHIHVHRARRTHFIICARTYIIRLHKRIRHPANVFILCPLVCMYLFFRTCTQTFFLPVSYRAPSIFVRIFQRANVDVCALRFVSINKRFLYFSRFRFHYFCFSLLQKDIAIFIEGLQNVSPVQ